MSEIYLAQKLLAGTEAGGYYLAAKKRLRLSTKPFLAGLTTD